MNARYHPRYDLSPADASSHYSGYGEWKGAFERSPAHQPGDKVLGISAGTDTLGAVIIRMDILRDGRIVTLSPYYNQFAYDHEPNPDCDEGALSECDQVHDNPREYLSNMALATDWESGDWHELGSCPANWNEGVPR